MKVLDQFSFGTFGGQTKQKHPWADWADGKIREFEQGKDFTSKPDSFATQARDYAKKNKLRVRINLPKGSTVVTLQFLTEQQYLEQVAAAPIEPANSTPGETVPGPKKASKKGKGIEAAQ